ncbi:MAG: polysaccharide biosynthesis/export family protein [Pseudomonadota bacterium]
MKPNTALAKGVALLAALCLAWGCAAPGSAGPTIQQRPPSASLDRNPAGAAKTPGGQAWRKAETLAKAPTAETSTAKPPAAQTNTATQTDAVGRNSEVDDSYVIGQADELEIQVWQEPDLSRTTTVRADGKISLPLVEEVKAEGLTVRKLRQLLTELYKDVIADPVVSVMVSKALSATFFITGKVNKPGEYTLYKETTVLQALASAGGFAEWASTKKLVLIRTSGERMVINYERILKGDTRQNVLLRRGDTLVIP